MYFIAKTVKGAEYAYNRMTAHSVPKASKDLICKALNETRYQLKDGEAWHVYEGGQYEQEYTSAGFMRFARRNGALVEIRS